MLGALRYAWAKSRMRSNAKKIARGAEKSGDTRAVQAIANLSVRSHVMSDRLTGAILLGELGLPDAVPSIVTLLADDYLEVAIEAARALGKIGDPGALPSLQVTKDNGSVDIRLRIATTKAMTAILERVRKQL